MEHGNWWICHKIKKPIKSKWVFAVKTNSDGEVMRYKARLVAKGFSQMPGIDFDETFAPVVKYTSIRFCLAIAAVLDLEITQMDVVTAFLYGDLKENVYMEQPEFFNNGTPKVCKLEKSIYGLKQASRNWNELLNQTLLNFGLTRSNTDQCIYFLIKNGNVLIVLIYVDDFLIMFNNKRLEAELKSTLSSKFRMKYLGEVSTILGMRISRDRSKKTISIDQTKYIYAILNKFGMSNCHPVNSPLDINQKLSSEMCAKDEVEKHEMSKIPYREAIGCLMYIAHVTRPDINFSINLLSRYSTNPGIAHWKAIKRVFRFLKATAAYKILYGTTKSNVLGYCDADWAGDLDNRKSTTGYVFLLNGGAISWSTKKQPTVALSTTEAEYMAIVNATQEAIWLRNLYNQFFPNNGKSILLHCDNQGALQLSKNGVFSPRTKHIHIKLEFIKECIENKIINLTYISTNEMLADIFTKGIAKDKLYDLCKQFGLH